jgi:hypothetical protein
LEQVPFPGKFAQRADCHRNEISYGGDEEIKGEIQRRASPRLINF